MDPQLFDRSVIDQLLAGLRVAGGCALIASSAHRCAPWLGDRDVAPRLVTGGIVAAWLVTVGVALLGAVGLLDAKGLIGFAALLFISTRLLPAPRRMTLDRRRRMLRQVAPVLAFAAPMIVWDLGWRLPAPATAWDALTYHLYMPARWLLEGRLVHVPTVFGDPAAAFAPQNGALLFAWWLGLFGGDAITNVVNTLAACLFTAALARIARQCGAPREAAGLAAIGVFWIAPMRASIYSSLVDMWMLAFWAASLSFTVQALDRSRPAAWLAGGLATGLAIGTKLVGAVLLAPQVLLFAILLCVRRRPRALAGYFVAIVAGGGWWYLVDLVRYGNPLFPVDLKLGPWTVFAGAIPYDTFAGQFYLPIGKLPKTLLWQYGAVASALTTVGVSILLASATTSGPHRAARRLLAGVGLYWGSYYAFSLPHNAQTRFFLPVVALALVGWAMALGGIQRRKRWASRLTWAVILMLLCLDIELEPWWRSTQPSPLAAGMSLRLWLPLVLVTVASIAGALFTRQLGRRRLLQGVATLGVLVSVAFAQSFATTRRDFYGTHTHFASRLAAAHALDQADPLATAHVGYTGFNLPYTLMGPHRTRFVRYVNIQGGLEDGFYDFWREEARLATRPKPAFYRGRGRYDTWLANLEAAEIEWVVIFQLVDSERYIPADADGFPIERQWAEMNPSRFELTASGRDFRLFRLLQRSEGNRQQLPDALLEAPVDVPAPPSRT